MDGGVEVVVVVVVVKVQKQVEVVVVEVPGRTEEVEEEGVMEE